MSTNDPAVLYQEEGAVAILTLNRLASLNIFTRQMHRDLWAALDRVQADQTIRALVLTGAVSAAAASSGCMRMLTIVPIAATPTLPPMLRKNCREDVATPRSPQATELCTAIVNGTLEKPNPRPSSAITAAR